MGLGGRIRRAARRVVSSGGNIAASTLQAGAQAAGDVLTPDINIPEAETPTPMPIPDEEAAKRQARRSRLRRRGRGGRSASVLSGRDELG